MSGADGTAGAPPRTSFVGRLLRTARLHADTFEEIEADHSSITQASAVVLTASLASAAVLGVRATMGRPPPFPESLLPFGAQVAVLALEPLVIWIVGAAFAYMVGATFFRGPETETDYPEVLRTTGFAFAPALIFPIAALAPEAMSLGLASVGRLWILAGCIVAVRQALDFTTARAIGTYGIAVGLMWLVLWGLTVTPLPV